MEMSGNFEWTQMWQPCQLVEESVKLNKLKDPAHVFSLFVFDIGKMSE